MIYFEEVSEKGDANSDRENSVEPKPTADADAEQPTEDAKKGKN